MPNDPTEPTPELALTPPDPPEQPEQQPLPGFEEMLREAIAEVKAELIAAIPQMQIPAGGNSPFIVNADDLPTSEKIRRGLAAPTRKD